MNFINYSKLQEIVGEQNYLIQLPDGRFSYPDHLTVTIWRLFIIKHWDELIEFVDPTYLWSVLNNCSNNDKILFDYDMQFINLPRSFEYINNKFKKKIMLV